GTVTLSSSLWLSIKHPDGFVVSYLHMYKSERLVDVGDTVSAGQQIGVVGNVPPSGGCHLDLRINKNGTTNQAVAALQEATALGAPAQYAGFVNPEE
ncbi:M23 family metallopeptidase, partial [Enterobacter hormaechei]